MKKTTMLYLLLATLFVWTACTKEKEKTRQEQLRGEWTETRTQTKVTLLNTPFPIPPIEVDTFKLVTYVKVIDDSNLQFTYRQNGRSQNANATWTLTDNDQKITVQPSGAIMGLENPVMEIRELTDTNLTLSTKQRQQLEVAGTRRDVEGEITMYFKRK